MNSARGERQLDRIRQIQARLNHILADETLDGLEQLADELKSRMATVLGMLNSRELTDAELSELNVLVMKQRELLGLMEARLQTFSAKLMAARKKTMVSKNYRISPAKFNAELVKSMDIKG